MHKGVDGHHQGNLKASGMASALGFQHILGQHSAFRSQIWFTLVHVDLYDTRRVTLDIYGSAHCTDEEIETQVILLTFSLNRVGVLAQSKGRGCPGHLGG